MSTITIFNQKCRKICDFFLDNKPQLQYCIEYVPEIWDIYSNTSLNEEYFIGLDKKLRKRNIKLKVIGEKNRLSEKLLSIINIKKPTPFDVGCFFIT